MSLQDQLLGPAHWDSTSAAYSCKRQRRLSLPLIITVGGALAASGTSSADMPELLLDPASIYENGTTAGVPYQLADSRPESISTSQAVSELRRLSGLTWGQLGQLFGVARRSIHYWASGEPLNSRNERRLRQILDIVRAADRGGSQLNRAALLTVHAGTSAFELLVEEQFERARALLGTGEGRRHFKLGELSPEAKAARAPLPPEELVGALHDSVHCDADVGRPVRTPRNLLRGSD
jgi:hypothetical protein